MARSNSSKVTRGKTIYDDSPSPVEERIKIPDAAKDLQTDRVHSLVQPVRPGSDFGKWWEPKTTEQIKSIANDVAERMGHGQR